MLLKEIQTQGGIFVRTSWIYRMLMTVWIGIFEQSFVEVGLSKFMGAMGHVLRDVSALQGSLQWGGDAPFFPVQRSSPR
jgi:hypothetical protein